MDLEEMTAERGTGDDIAHAIKKKKNEGTINLLDKIKAAGPIDYPVIVDESGGMHLFVERENGTAPPLHTLYSFLEYN